MTTTLAQKTSRAFFFVLFTPFLLGLVVVLELNAYHQSIEWIAHTNLVLSTMSALQLTITRAETAQRGFLLTEDGNYVQRFSDAKTEAARQISSMKALTADNAVQERNLQRLQAVVDERFGILDRLIQVRRNGALSARDAREGLRLGTGAVQQVRDTALRINQHENALLRTRTRTEREIRIWVGISFAVCILTNFAVLLWAYRLIEQYARAREMAAEQISSLNAELEQRVAARTAELELANAQLTRSNDDLTKFAYIASHDLQEPLRTIGSYVGLLSLRYKGKLDDQADKYITFVVEGAKRMQNLVQDLLTYSRVGTESLKVSPVNMQVVLQNVRESLDFLLREQQATIESDPMPKLVGDQGKLTQVFMNLVSNAIKFRKPDQPPIVRIGVSRSDAEWLFSVTDNGIGFEQQYAERIFAIFQRLHGVGAYPGTGMGLAICKRIIEQHEGRIWATSAPNRGSSFFFTLPADLSLNETPAENDLTSVKIGTEAVSK